MNKYLNMFRAGGKGKTFMRSADKLSKGVEKVADALMSGKGKGKKTKGGENFMDLRDKFKTDSNYKTPTINIDNNLEIPEVNEVNVGTELFDINGQNKNSGLSVFGRNLLNQQD